MICDSCGKEGARLRHITRSYGKGVSLLVIENVPVFSCPHYSLPMKRNRRPETP